MSSTKSVIFGTIGNKDGRPGRSLNKIILKFSISGYYDPMLFTVCIIFMGLFSTFTSHVVL